jgi:hypothetical protein
MKEFTVCCSKEWMQWCGSKAWEMCQPLITGALKSFPETSTGVHYIHGHWRRSGKAGAAADFGARVDFDNDVIGVFWWDELSPDLQQSAIPVELLTPSDLN